MKKINWKERFKNKIFWVNTILSEKLTGKKDLKIKYFG